MPKTVIPGPLSPGLALAMRVCGSIALVCGVLTGLFCLLTWIDNGPLPGVPLCVAYPITFIQIGLGYRLAVMFPALLRSERTRLLAEKLSAPPECQGDYEEVPLPATVAYVSYTTGLLAIFSFAPLFAPVAILSGLASIRKDTWRGLTGISLGIVGLLGWWFLLTYSGAW